MISEKKAKKLIQTADLPDIELLYISNHIINESIIAYTKEYKSKTVPFSFSKFYIETLEFFDEIKSNQIINKFYQQSDSSDYDIYCLIYYLTFKNVVKKLSNNNKDSINFELKAKTPPQSLSNNNENILINEAFAIIKKISNDLQAQSPHYIRQAYTKYLNDIKNNIRYTPYKEGNQLTGKSISMPEIENQKIRKLYIPSLPLPTRYPRSKNRIHSSYHINKLCSLSKQLDILLNEKIIAVKYSKNFSKYLFKNWF